MAVYTKFHKENIEEILSSYEIGKLNSFKGIQEGIENTNYFLLVDNKKYILTIYEKRVNEKDGVDYHFISVESFKNKIDNGNFIEYEKVYNEIYYGTLKSELEKLIQKHNIIFDVDVIGAISLKKYFSKKSISIFINPGSIEVLETRLTNRGIDTKSSLKERLSKAKNEMDMINNFDTSIINDDLDHAKTEIFKTVDFFLNN